MVSSLTTGNTATGPTRPRIKSPLLSSRIPRCYLRLHVHTSEDTSLSWGEEYQIRTTATGPYRRIRASTERARARLGLDQSFERQRSRPGLLCGAPPKAIQNVIASAARPCWHPFAGAFPVSRDGLDGDEHGPDLYLSYTSHGLAACLVTGGVRRPLQEAAGQEPRARFWHPTGCRLRLHREGRPAGRAGRESGPKDDDPAMAPVNGWLAWRAASGEDDPRPWAALRRSELMTCGLKGVWAPVGTSLRLSPFSSGALSAQGYR